MWIARVGYHDLPKQHQKAIGVVFYCSEFAIVITVYSVEQQQKAIVVVLSCPS
jgi:hypothetical protein